MAHPQDDYALGAVWPWLYGVGQDVGESRYVFFIGARHAAFSACGHSAEGVACVFDFVDDSEGCAWVFGGNVLDDGVQIIECILRPEDLSHNLALPTNETVSRKRTMASAWDTTRPAFMSASPRSIPETISNSRST